MNRPHSALAAAIVIVVLIGAAVLLAACGGGEEQAAADRAWLLPTALLASPAEEFQVGEVDGALWPPGQTVSLWETGEDWVVTHSFPLPPDNVLGTIPLLGFVFGDAILPPAESVAVPGEVPEPPDDGQVPRELGFYASEGIHGRLLGALQAGIREDPDREAMGAPLSVYADGDGNYDPELRALVESVTLAGRAELPWSPGVQVVFAFGDPVGAIALATPIPLELIPAEVTEITPGEGYEVHHTAAEALIVRDGSVHAVVRSSAPAEQAAAAGTVAEVDDLNWGEWAWPQLATRLRLAALAFDPGSADAGCSAVITLDGGCFEEVTPDGGFEWPGGAPSLEGNADGTWTARLPLDRLPGGVPGTGRLGVVHQNQVLVEFDAGDVPGTVEAAFPSRRDALRVITMLYPEEPFMGGDR